MLYYSNINHIPCTNHFIHVIQTNCTYSLILTHPAEFFFIINKRKYAVKHNTLISYHYCKELPDDGSCEPKHVAMCAMALQRCVGRHIFVCLKMHLQLTNMHCITWWYRPTQSYTFRNI
jgi:hypothetical protein